jgi:hypothetical protein|tara:strand:+ start:344 stop:712 length:369 start_codon:yes stop_codon:yes gene_type:complete
MSYKIEKEIIELRIPMLEAYDSGNEKLGDEFADLISELAIIYNSGKSKEEYYEIQQYEKELNIIPSIIRDEVLAAMTKSNLNKEMVDRWNIYLDFDLHTKVKRYGYIGSARLFKIFSLKVIA